MKNRSIHFRWHLGRRHFIELKLRRFRVASSQRSLKQRQFVVDINAFGIRQLVIQLKLQRPVGRPKKSKRSAFDVSGQHLQTASSLLLIIAGIAGAVFWGSQLVISKSLQPAKAFATPVAHQVLVPKTLPASQPLHISIPNINIDADITPVGLNANGAITLPAPTSWQVGWYSGSPTPGQLGPSVIVGHVDSTSTISVFWRLRYVKAGDTVSITRTDGSTAIFTVTGLDQYDQNNFPTDTVYGNLDYAGLKLITCGGTFDEQTQHYTENTVVSAQLK